MSEPTQLVTGLHWQPRWNQSHSPDPCSILLPVQSSRRPQLHTCVQLVTFCSPHRSRTCTTTYRMESIFALYLFTKHLPTKSCQFVHSLPFSWNCFLLWPMFLILSVRVMIPTCEEETHSLAPRNLTALTQTWRAPSGTHLSPLSALCLQLPPTSTITS